MKKIQTTILLALSFAIYGHAQVGINTDAPSALLEVVSSTTASAGKAFITSNSDNIETFQIQNSGYIGVGVLAPLVKLDLRSSSLAIENALGIGNTTQTATDAGAGAIRYNETVQALEYSDGTDWFRLQVNPNKAMVIAQNSYGQTYIPVWTNDIYYTIGTTIANWTSIYDRNGNFNPVTGIFKAPRDGVYSASVTAVFTDISMTAGAQYELWLRNLTLNTKLKSTVPYLSKVESMELTNVCKSLVYLTAGQELVVYVYMNWLESNVTMSSDGSLNVLTIAEM